VGVRSGRAGREMADEGSEGDRDRAVVVGEGGQCVGDDDGAAEFFAEFAGEGGRGEFAGLDLAAGKFPLQAEVFVGGALRGEDAARGILKDGADDGERKRGGHEGWHNHGEEGRGATTPWRSEANQRSSHGARGLSNGKMFRL
jgi:hypothetical protein